MDYVQHFYDLDTYKHSRILSREIFNLSKGFPKEEMYSLTDQMRRSSRSIGAAIAEAWGKRSYEKHFLSKLTDADSEQLETIHWIFEARDCCYISEVQANDLLIKCQTVGRMLNQMMSKSSFFCIKKKP